MSLYCVKCFMLKRNKNVKIKHEIDKKKKSLLLLY